MSAMDEARVSAAYLQRLSERGETPSDSVIQVVMVNVQLAIAEELRTANLIAAYRQNLIWGDAKDVTIAIRDRLGIA